MKLTSGKDLYKFAASLYPITRSVSSPGNLETLKLIKKRINNLEIKSFNSGSKVYSWKIPYEWHITEAYVADSKGKKNNRF